MTDAQILSLDGRVNDPARARRFVRDQLTGVAEATCADALLAVSELVTNVHLHGGTPADLVLRVNGRAVRIEVYDSGPAIPIGSVRLPLPTDGGGRGLFIVAALATSWGIRTDVGCPGKTVWIELAG